MTDFHPVLRRQRRFSTSGPLAAGLAAAALLGACVATQQTGNGVFSAERAAPVFMTGYESIASRYVENIAIGTVAFDALQSLSTLDSEIHVERDGTSVALKRGATMIAGFPAPADDDADAWADLTVKVLGASRANSRSVMSASAEDLYRAVFDKALADLDEFSRYAGRDLAGNHRSLRDGFGGVGFEYTLTSDHVLKVTTIVADTPAERNGLLTGDVVTEIDGRSVAGLDREEISRRLRGQVKTTVSLTLRRAGSDGPMKLTFERALIVPPTVTARLENGIAYLAISSFNQKTAESASVAFDRLKKEGKVKGVILDLRNNPGGLLDQAVAVADLFLGEGEIVATEGRHPDSNQRFEASGNDITGGLPLAVLINGDSASSAEIVAAALQDRKRAVLVGSNSFGKGTVQNVIHLPNDGELTLTWSRILAPSGYVFHRLGVMPALCTSKESLNVRDLETDLRGGHAAAGTLLAAWRAGRGADSKAIDELRASCPPKHDLSAADVEIARDLIADSELYARALNLSGPALASEPGAASPGDSVARR